MSPKGATEEQYRVCANDILFARTGASVGKTYLYDTNDGLLYFAGFLIRAKITRANARFVFAQTLTEKYNRWVATTSMRSGQPGINAKEYETLPISITDAVEQNKISDFLTQLDLRIDKQRSLINTLKLYKRGLVRRIFPHTESLQPELRMTTYSGPWQSAKIGDIGSVLMCKRIYKEQTSTSGDVPFYKIGTFGGTADSYIPRELFLEYKAKYPYPQKGDVLISASGSIGRTVVFSGQDEYFQDSNIIWVKFDGTITNHFWKHLCAQLHWEGIEGSTIKRLYNDNVLNTRISFPTVDEQEIISKLLDNVDRCIFQAEKTTSALIYMKNAFMQQLFI